jgi:hypothetical protein
MTEDEWQNLYENYETACPFRNLRRIEEDFDVDDFLQ